MKPTNNRILVKVIEKKVKKGETAPPATAVFTAKVMGTGPAVEVVKNGDLVVFAPFGIDEVMVKDEKMLILEESQVIAIHG